MTSLLRFVRPFLLAAVAFLLLTVPSRAQSSRHELHRQNQRLTEENDSLRLLVRDLEDSLAAARQLASELALHRSEPGKSAQWYTNGINDFHFGPVAEQELEQFSLEVPDSVLVERLEALHCAVPLTYNDDVRKWIGIFLRKKSLPRMIGLSRYYFPILEEALLTRGLPEELKYLAVIESEFIPTAKSRSGALGLMQFMPKTAKGFGLTWDSFRDDRLDPYKSAAGAADVLAAYYRRYEDWPLAISAYNFGPGNIDKAMERAIRDGHGTDYHSAREYFFGRMGKGPLSVEAREYMGRFVAAVYVFHYYQEHGIEEDPAAVPEELVEFEVKDLLHFQQVSDLVGVPVEVLEQFNPQYYRDIIRGDSTDILRIPASYLHDYVQVEDSLYLHKKDEYLGPRVITRTDDGRIIPAATEYTVQQGDNLGKISRKFGVSVSQLKEWNHLKSDHLRIGQRLIVNGLAAEAAKKSTSSSSSSSSGSGQKADEFTTYKVKSGDTLFKIAKAHGVSVDQLKKWNSLKSDNVKVGQKLKIKKK